MTGKRYNVPLPPADRSFTAPVKTRVSAAVLFSSVSDQTAPCPHPTGKSWNESILDDRPGAGQVDPALSERIDQNWQDMWERLTSEVGMSVPHAVDFPKLMEQRKALVRAVIMGRADLVEQALSQGADPNALVPVRHPNQLPHQKETFVALPIGVAAAMLWKRYHDTARREGVLDRPDVIAQSYAYKSIARRLLFNENENLPTVKVGTAPDGTGLSLSFYSWGVEKYAKPDMPTNEQRALGGMSLVRHNEPVNMTVFTALADISPELVADHRILPQNEADPLIGHAFEAEQALDSLAHLRRVELGQKPLGSTASQAGPVSPKATSRATRIALDYRSGSEINLDFGKVEPPPSSPSVPRPA